MQRAYAGGAQHYCGSFGRVSELQIQICFEMSNKIDLLPMFYQDSPNTITSIWN